MYLIFGMTDITPQNKVFFFFLFEKLKYKV